LKNEKYWPEYVYDHFNIMHMDEYVEKRMKEVMEYLDKFKQEMCKSHLEELAKFYVLLFRKDKPDEENSA